MMLDFYSLFSVADFAAEQMRWWKKGMDLRASNVIVQI